MKLCFWQIAAPAWLRPLALLAATPWTAWAAQPALSRPVDSARQAPRPAALGATLAVDSLGVYVASVEPESLASQAGLRSGDRLLAVNGRAVLSAAEALRIIDDNKPGARFKIELNRDGRTGTVWFIAAANSSALRERAQRDLAAPPGRAEAALGVTLYDGPYIGLRVSSVEANGPAAVAGLQAGDRLLSINGVDAANSGDVLAFVARSQPGDPVQLRIDRQGAEASLIAVLGQRDTVFGRRLPPVRYRGPADEAPRFYQPPPPGEIGD